MRVRHEHTEEMPAGDINSWVEAIITKGGFPDKNYQRVIICADNGGDGTKPIIAMSTGGISTEMDVIGTMLMHLVNAMKACSARAAEESVKTVAEALEESDPVQGMLAYTVEGAKFNGVMELSATFITMLQEFGAYYTKLRLETLEKSNNPHVKAAWAEVKDHGDTIQ